VIPLTRAIPERIRGGYDDALYKSTFTYLLYFTIPVRHLSTAFSKIYIVSEVRDLHVKKLKIALKHNT